MQMQYMPVVPTHTNMPFFTQLKQYFNVYAMIFFSKFVHVKNPANQLKMQINYGFDIFYYKGHNL
jgi:hypothetical protein